MNKNRVGLRAQFSLCNVTCIVCLTGLRLTRTWNCGDSLGSPQMAFSGRGRCILAWPRPLHRPLAQQTPSMQSRSIPNSPCLQPALTRRLTSAASTATKSHTRIILRWSSDWWWRHAAQRSFWSSRHANCSWPMLRWSVYYCWRV